MLWGLSSLIFLKKRIQSRGVDAEQFIEPSKANSPSWELSRNREQPSELCGILQHFMHMHELSGIFGGKLIPLLSQIMVDQITLREFFSLLSTKGKCIKTTMLFRIQALALSTKGMPWSCRLDTEGISQLQYQGHLTTDGRTGCSDGVQTQLPRARYSFSVTPVQSLASLVSFPLTLLLTLTFVSTIIERKGLNHS